MPQKLVNIQEQKQQQVQRLTAQQMLNVHLLEMPLSELEQSVNAEIDDNPALEINENGGELKGQNEEARDDSTEETFEQQTEREERADALDAALESIGSDDQMPDYHSPSYGKQTAEYEEIVYGDPVSFYDKLREQMGEQMLTEQQREIMEYLIGSLDDDGLLRKELDTIADELAIYHHIDVSTADIEEVLHVLQTFDPPGIGARNLQECLLLQIRRKPDSVWKERMEKVVRSHFEAFTKKKLEQDCCCTGTDRRAGRNLADRNTSTEPEARSSVGRNGGQEHSANNARLHRGYGRRRNAYVFP